MLSLRLARLRTHAMSARLEPGRTQRLQYQFTAHLRDPDHCPAPAGIEDRRMGIYRDLVFCNVEMFLSANFPVIRTLYDEDTWNGLTRDFLREHQCHTPLFPEFGREFLRYVEARQQRGAGDPPFLLELAHYEWAELALALDENDLDAVPHDAAGDPLTEVPVISPLACVLGYRFPVQLIGPDFRPTQAPADPTLLLLVRGHDDEVRFHEIDALSALLIERLQENTRLTGLQCLDALLAERDDTDAAALREAGKAVLIQLKAREAILGTTGA
jgi:hypothetical protein